jgi:phage protein D
MVGSAPALRAGIKITVDGSEPQSLQLIEVVVEQSVHLPDMCVLRLYDLGDSGQPTKAIFFDLIDGSTFPIGGSLEVELGDGDSLQSVFKGEITAVELEATELAMPIVTVRGYSRAHRLHRNRQSRSFIEMTDSDIASKVATEAGLQATVDDTTDTHDYVLQYNQTDWEFLKDRAARNGYEVVVDDRTVNFRKPKNGQDTAPDQTLWDNLINIRVKMSTAFQTDEVIVRGWDPQTKAAIVGNASSGALHPTIGESKTGKAMSSDFGASKVYVVNQPVASQSEATTLAKAIYDELDGAFVEAEGTCVGNPQIKAGATVKMASLGTRMTGDYYVTSAVHSVQADGEYTTSFVVSGRRANTLHDLLGASQRGGGPQGVVIGTVTNVTDDKDQGRVKVKLPWLSDDDETGWVRVATPMGGSGRGFFYLPEIDDEVLVSFEHGDPSRPYVVGFLWNGTDSPPKKNSEAVANGKVNLRVLKTRSGHTITLDDTEGSEKIEIVD